MNKSDGDIIVFCSLKLVIFNRGLKQQNQERKCTEYTFLREKDDKIDFQE